MRLMSAVGRVMTCCVLFVLALNLVGCASNSTAQMRPTATPTLIPIPPTRTPEVLPIHTISMGGFKAQLAIPGGPAGLLLYPAVQTSFAGLPYISFYRYSDQQVIQIAKAPTEPNGSVGGIIRGAYAGDWVSFVTDDANQANWVVWTYNVKTGQRTQVISQVNHGGALIGTAANATDLVLSVSVGLSNGGATARLLDYTYATRQTRTLYTSATEILKPLAMNATTLLFVETDPTTDADTTWIQQLSQTAPGKIADGGGVNGWMSSRYAVWDDPKSGGTALYDLNAGNLDPNFANCIRPAIADPQPYMTCVQFSSKAWVLVHIPDGAETPFDTGQATLGDGGQIYNGRAFFIDPQGDVQYFDLPSQ